MKYPIRFRTGRAVPTAAVLLMLALLLPAPISRAAAADAPTPTPVMKPTSVSFTEDRIQALHEKLHVLPEQDEQWQEVARVMRDNAIRMESLILKARSRKGKTSNALDDLRAYGEIVKAHADGILNFIPVFEAFYTRLSEEQKAIIAHDDIKF
jgi:hypothetical protein